MRIVDLNILLYTVNSEAAEHERAHTWWEHAVNDEEIIGLTWVVLLGFLRLSTNPRVFPRPPLHLHDRDGSVGTRDDR